MSRRAFNSALAMLLTILLGAGPIEAGHQSPDGIPDDAEAATVRAIVDGDTIRITLEDGTRDTVRLIGIDAPEPKDPNHLLRCYADESTDRIAKLLPIGREIWLEPDVSDRDRYDRLLRYVWVEEKGGDEYLVNTAMVRDGFALATPYPPDTVRSGQFERAQERASDAERGLWSACPDLVASLTPTAAENPAEVPVAAAPTQPASIATCDPSYPTLCLPIGSGDLDCGDITARLFPVSQPDPHRFDGDYDGIGCES
jgi:micrococcal nuclease